jgi:hypothetical protein
MYMAMSPNGQFEANNRMNGAGFWLQAYDLGTYEGASLIQVTPFLGEANDTEANVMLPGIPFDFLWPCHADVNVGQSKAVFSQDVIYPNAAGTDGIVVFDIQCRSVNAIHWNWGLRWPDT